MRPGANPPPLHTRPEPSRRRAALRGSNPAGCISRGAQEYACGVASFNDFANLCLALSQTQSRLQIAALAAEFLNRLDRAEAPAAARFMVGKALPQGAAKPLNLSGRAIWKIAAEIAGAEDQGEEIFAAATDFGEAIEMALKRRAEIPEPTLTIAEVERKFTEIAAIEGRNSRRLKLDALRNLLLRATPLEGKFLAKILIGEMRHGMSEGLMLEALATMAARPVAEVRRINMVEGDAGRTLMRLTAPGGPSTIAPAAEEIRTAASDAAPAPGGGDHPLPADETPRPLKPMLAQPAANIADAFRILDGSLALEHKLDGARVQIHSGPFGVRIWSRRLNEITRSLPEVVEAIGRLEERRAIFDGEVIAIDPGGRPLAFQDVMRRFGRVREVARMRAERPVRLFVFDLIGLDGNLLIDEPYERRYAALAELADVAGLELPSRIIPDSAGEGARFFARAIAGGYEGVMAKALASPYTPGARGRGWLKIKQARTLDLAIVAAEWGYGRRHGWLSNYHLAARDPHRGGFVEVGKTFKGLTDEDFREMTERLLALKIEERRGVVIVRPEIVVEVAYSDIQRSPQYDGGMALRFARIVGIRADKSADEADTIDAVAAAFDRQALKPLGAP
jgi:DNA ligase-1